MHRLHVRIPRSHSAAFCVMCTVRMTVHNVCMCIWIIIQENAGVHVHALCMLRSSCTVQLNRLAYLIAQYNTEVYKSLKRLEMMCTYTCISELR